jgi:3-phosphoinositide dependent protein kinase-1
MIDNTGHIKLGDFGSACRVGHSATASSSALDTVGMDGTAEYLSPEVIAGHARTPACDWWAVGCVLFQLLAGRVPFFHNDRQKLFAAITSGAIDFADEMPDTARHIIQLFLERNVAQRLNPDSEQGFAQVCQHRLFDGMHLQHVAQATAPPIRTGSVAASKISMKLRQRRYSMLLTSALPQKYQYQTVSLDTIAEEDDQDLLDH